MSAQAKSDPCTTSPGPWVNVASVPLPAPPAPAPVTLPAPARPLRYHPYALSPEAAQALKRVYKALKKNREDLIGIKDRRDAASRRWAAELEQALHAGGRGSAASRDRHCRTMAAFASAAVSTIEHALAENARLVGEVEAALTEAIAICVGAAGAGGRTSRLEELTRAATRHQQAGERLMASLAFPSGDEAVAAARTAVAGAARTAGTVVDDETLDDYMRSLAWVLVACNNPDDRAANALMSAPAGMLARLDLVPEVTCVCERFLTARQGDPRRLVALDGARSVVEALLRASVPMQPFHDYYLAELAGLAGGVRSGS